MKAALFLNGTPPDKKLALKVIAGSDIIIAADGGAEFLYANDIVPGVLIGDLDSCSFKVMEQFRKKGVPVVRIREQETTDFEKALKFCKEHGVKKIDVLSGFSQRPDHTLNNFSVMKRYSKAFILRLLTDEFECFYAHKSVSFDYPKNEVVSMLAAPKASGIVTRGLKYPLKGESLEFGKREGTLNISVSGKVSISFRNGTLIIFKKHFLD